MVESTLLERAVKLHGHLGPFLVLGLRMALKADEVLGRLKDCKMWVVQKKPHLCAVDGVRTIVGEVDVDAGDGIAAEFQDRVGNKLYIEILDEVIRRYEGVSWEECEEKAHEVLGSKDEELFKIKRVVRAPHLL